MKSKTLLQVGLCALPSIGLVLFLRTLFLYASTAPVSFDGAMNLNTAASFAGGTGYGFFYNEFFPFPAQTDGPFILPAALLIRLFGVTPLVTQAVNVVYIVLLIALLIALLKRLGLPLWAALVGTLLTVSVPGFAEYGMNGYGEIPSLAWYVAGLLAIGAAFDTGTSRSNAFFGGACLSLAYLTKVVALALVVPVAAVAAIAAIRKQLSRQAAVQLCLGFLVPILLWETFRLFSIGSVDGFVQWWRLQLGQVFHQSGASHGLNALVAKAHEHYSILCAITGLNGFWLLLFLVLPSFLFLLERNGLTGRQQFVLGCLLIGGGLYFAWWLLLTPTPMAWLRRILNGILIHQLLIFVLAFRVLASALRRVDLTLPTKGGAMALPAIAVFPVLLLASNGQIVTRPHQTPGDSASFFELARLVRALPADAVIFGTGWWQSPGLALYSGRKFHNFQRWTSDEINNIQGKKYFVFDQYAFGIAKHDVADALELTDSREVFKSDVGGVYSIERARDYAPLEVGASDLAKLRSAMDFAEADYEFKRGFYEIEEKRHAWMRTAGMVVLVRNAERRLIVSLVVPDTLIKEGPAELRVQVPDCADETVGLDKPWDKTVEVRLNCPPGAVAAPLFAYLSVNRHVPFVRQIDADNRLLSVLVRSVKLAD
jgi:hypothetical protein